MKIKNAPPDVAETVKQIIARQMAEHLISTGADMSCADHVAASLAAAGFGQKSIAALLDDVTELVAEMRGEVK